MQMRFKDLRLRSASKHDYAYKQLTDHLLLQRDSIIWIQIKLTKYLGRSNSKQSVFEGLGRKPGWLRWDQMIDRMFARFEFGKSVDSQKKNGASLKSFVSIIWDSCWCLMIRIWNYFWVAEPYKLLATFSCWHNKSTQASDTVATFLWHFLTVIFRLVSKRGPVDALRRCKEDLPWWWDTRYYSNDFAALSMGGSNDSLSFLVSDF